MKQTMFESLVEEFPNQEQQLNIIFRKLGLDKSFPNPNYRIRQNGKTTKGMITIFIKMFLLKEFKLITFGGKTYSRIKFDSNFFGQMLERLYPKKILDEHIERTKFGFEIIKDFDREVKE